MGTGDEIGLGRDYSGPNDDNTKRERYCGLLVDRYQVSITEHVPLGGAPETVIKITLRGKSLPNSQDQQMNTAVVYCNPGPAPRPHVLDAAHQIVMYVEQAEFANILELLKRSPVVTCEYWLRASGYEYATFAVPQRPVGHN
jgi:hypothetical protein